MTTATTRTCPYCLQMTMYPITMGWFCAGTRPKDADFPGRICGSTVGRLQAPAR